MGVDSEKARHAIFWSTAPPVEPAADQSKVPTIYIVFVLAGSLTAYSLQFNTLVTRAQVPPMDGHEKEAAQRHFEMIVWLSHWLHSQSESLHPMRFEFAVAVKRFRSSCANACLLYVVIRASRTIGVYSHTHTRSDCIPVKTECMTQGWNKLKATSVDEHRDTACTLPSLPQLTFSIQGEAPCQCCGGGRGHADPTASVGSLWGSQGHLACLLFYVGRRMPSTCKLPSGEDAVPAWFHHSLHGRVRVSATRGFVAIDCFNRPSCHNRACKRFAS